jgi:hypothetical protein
MPPPPPSSAPPPPASSSRSSSRPGTPSTPGPTDRPFHAGPLASRDYNNSSRNDNSNSYISGGGGFGGGGGDGGALNRERAGSTASGSDNLDALEREAAGSEQLRERMQRMTGVSEMNVSSQPQLSSRKIAKLRSVFDLVMCCDLTSMRKEHAICTCTHTHTRTHTHAMRAHLVLWCGVWVLFHSWTRTRTSA